MLISVEQMQPLLRHADRVTRRGCNSGATDRLAQPSNETGRLPVFVDFDNSVIRRDDVNGNDVASPVDRSPRRAGSSFMKRLLSPDKAVTLRNLDRFVSLLLSANPRPVVLIVGGGTVGQGMDALYQSPDIQVVAFDIYASPIVHFVADAHDIPLLAGTVDGVIVQAVLEHVVEPQQVVAEIWRVLKPDGLVYAETPFLQHVHEGAYDFSRFTESGHRWLFKRFDVIASGVCGGPGMQLTWSIDYFVRGLFRSWAAGKIAKLAFFWLRWFDRFIPESFASDAASGFYLLARRTHDEIAVAELVSFYRGAQQRAQPG